MFIPPPHDRLAADEADERVNVSGKIKEVCGADRRMSQALQGDATFVFLQKRNLQCGYACLSSSAETLTDVLQSSRSFWVTFLGIIPLRVRAAGQS